MQANENEDASVLENQLEAEARIEDASSIICVCGFHHSLGYVLCGVHSDARRNSSYTKDPLSESTAGTAWNGAIPVEVAKTGSIWLSSLCLRYYHLCIMKVLHFLCLSSVYIPNEYYA
jgi:hypothetical protein